jgi:DNA-directed RNA polymerase subunit RPC12/RpoP
MAPTTGLVCPSCTRPVAHIEKRTERTLMFVCPECGHRWSADEPETPEE